MATKSHRTPVFEGTWLQIAEVALKVPVERIVRLGRVESGSEGKYAGCRVWFKREETGRVRSSLVVARDELRSGRDMVEAEGAKWAPYAVWGCEPCSEECELHGANARTAVDVGGRGR